MIERERYSRSAVVVATLAWLIIAAMSAALIVANYSSKLSVPAWLLGSAALLFLVSVFIATAVPRETRCKLTMWCPLLWWF